ncbi:hypothetical protein BTVI_80233 [Pitangus sulphuratus]|nr:hypothetical protein BTVI_80233 [Pitangus sulphuratus]
MPAGSKADPPLAKAKPIQQWWLYLWDNKFKKEKNLLHGEKLQTERSENMRETTLQSPRVVVNGSVSQWIVTSGIPQMSVLFSVFTSDTDKGIKYILMGFSKAKCKDLPSESQALETSGKVWSNEDLASVEKDQVKEHLNKFAIMKSIGVGRVHLGGLRELMS